MAIRTVDAKCPNCESKMTVQVGLKSTAREVRCEACGKGYDYSCWSMRKPKPGVEVFKTELFEMSPDEDDDEDEEAESATA